MENSFVNNPNSDYSNDKNTLEDQPFVNNPNSDYNNDDEITFYGRKTSDYLEIDKEEESLTPHTINGFYRKNA